MTHLEYPTTVLWVCSHYQIGMAVRKVTLLHQYPTTELWVFSHYETETAVRRGSDTATSISYYRAVGLITLSDRDGS